MSEQFPLNPSRRRFLKSAAVAASSATWLTACGDQSEYKPPSMTQRARKREGNSRLSLIPCNSYEADIFSLLKDSLNDLDLPSLKGKSVFLKTNLIEYRPDVPIVTNPDVLKAAFQLADHLGAKDIKCGDGPANVRDVPWLLEMTGVGNMCKKLGLEFVDLNTDDLVKVENPDNFSGIPYFWLPRKAVTADALISVPKMKTHHWTRITCSMKNFFGVVPGRLYGWPKNILHHHGIDNCIVDLNTIVRPSFTVVDAIVAMEGDGPLNGSAKASNFLALGSDLAAIDATCARAMKINPLDVAYLKLAGLCLGNIDPENIVISGASLASLEQKFSLPINFQNIDKQQRQRLSQSDSA